MEDHGRRVLVYPRSLNRRIGALEQEIRHPKMGVVSQLDKLSARIDSIFWLAVGTLATVLLGTATLVIEIGHFVK